MNHSFRIASEFFQISTKFIESPKLFCHFFTNQYRWFCKGQDKWQRRTVVNREPIIMKLETPEFKSCITEEVNLLRNLFTSNGYEIRIVGGAVRDLLLGVKPHDLDFATTATPNEMKSMFTNQNIRMINEGGEKHGTITPRINEQNFEVTTLRVDIVTDGRHAEIEYTKDWYLDANRRDLTINAMYLDFDGNLYDYFNGYEDLKKNKVVFVGDAATRIQEDYLRILRYFRFYGKIAKGPDNHDQDVIKAITENVEGLRMISGERIWTELAKIASGNFAGELVYYIIKLGIGPYICLPERCNEAELKRVWDRLKLKDISVKPVTLLSALFDTEEEFAKFHSRVKLSSFDRDLGFFIISNRQDKIHPKPLRPYQLFVMNGLGSIPNKREFVTELLKYKGDVNMLEEFKSWNLPKFPVNGNVLRNMLTEKGCLGGRNFGVVMTKLKEIWANHDFDLSAENLLERVPEVIDSSPEIKIQGKRK